jgi:hypothetical protein
LRHLLEPQSPFAFIMATTYIVQGGTLFCLCVCTISCKQPLVFFLLLPRSFFSFSSPSSHLTLYGNKPSETKLDLLGLLCSPHTAKKEISLDLLMHQQMKQTNGGHSLQPGMCYQGSHLNWKHYLGQGPNPQCLGKHDNHST